MTEINIILDTNFEELSETTLKNDKELFYELLNQDFDIYALNNYSKYRIPYNQLLNDLLFNDNYLDYEKDLYNIDSINIKKLILKKVLIFFNPIIKTILDVKKSSIIDKLAVNLNYPINAKIISKDKKLINRRLSANSYFLINGLYNTTKSINYNLPFKLDNFKYINQLIIKLLYSIGDISINLSHLNYNNLGTFDITKIDNDVLKELYLIYLNLFLSNLNNNILINSNINYLLNNNSGIELYNKLYKDQNKLIDVNYSKNYITSFNKFLSYKINDYFTNHSYYAFQSNDLLHLYEEILIYSIDKESTQNKINNILLGIENLKEYNNNKKIIDEYNLKYIQLEYLTKKRFPNLFNPNSKDVIFYKHKQFNLNDLPKKYKDIILIDYKKLQNYANENIKNKCKHKDLIKELNSTNNKYPIVKELNALIQGNPNNNDEYYKCILCSYNLICPHILEYYNLLFSKKDFKIDNDFSIRQHLINKYMTNAKVNMIYYCKVCGEELGQSLDLEQNIEYQDKVKLNTSEYSDETLEMVRNNTMHIVYSYIVFTSLNINISKKYLINYIFTSILTNINLIEKSLRKAKIYTEEQIKNLLDFNSIIFIYASLIFIMTKYPFISFIQTQKRSYAGKGDIIIAGRDSTNIIIPKKVEIKSNKDLLNLIKLRFKEAYEIIVSTNNILLYKLKYNKQQEKIKELLIKTYGIVAKNDQMTLNEKTDKMLNSNLLINSSIFNYYYLIKSIYPLKAPSQLISSLPISSFNSKLYNSDISKLDITNYDKILNLSNINSNKIDNLFSNFSSPIIDEKLLNKVLQNDKISDYNEYKILSFNLFYYHIKYELYNVPIYDSISTEQVINNKLSKFITNNVYLDKLKSDENNNLYTYIKLSQLVKLYEIELINNNIKYNLYPFSLIKLNNSRYFYKKDIHLNIYFCSTDGFPHNFNIYVFLDNKKNKIEINKKQLDKNIDNIYNLNFLDYKCSKCNNEKNTLVSSKITNNNIIKLINDNNDKDGFFNLYINVCPVTIKNKITQQDDMQFHKFDYKNTGTGNGNDYKNIVCELCKIKYIDLLDKKDDIYLQYSKEYEDYKNKKQNIINTQLHQITKRFDYQYNKNIKDIYKDNLLKLNILSSVLSNSNDIMSIINNINYDTTVVNFSKQFTNADNEKINIIFLQKIGLTEGYEYNEKQLNTINNTYTLLRINKLVSYFRTMLIYYNLLKYNKNLTTHYDLDFFNLINKLQENNQFKTKVDKYLPDIKYNISDLIISLKLQYDNEYITKFLIKLILQFILDLDQINKSKFDNNLNIFIQFILTKILKFDELFTNFNYAQLKQMFNEDKFDMNTPFQENEEYDNEDDDDLFGYNDLNIQFEDEEPFDN